MTDTDDLKTIRSQIVARLLEITKSPKPSYSIDGQSVSWTEYQRLLLEQIKGIDEILAGGAEPVFETTQGFT